MSLFPKKNKILTITHPEIAAQWHPTKNGELTPNDVVAGSGKKVWWKCDKGNDHEWEAEICRRTRKNSGCGVCNRRTASASNCLAITHSEIAAQWHPTKNSRLTPNDVVSGSGKKVWWKCDKGDDHEWEAPIYNRTVLGTGCAVCSRRKPSVTTCLSATHPDLAKQWHPTKNANLTPELVTCGSNKKVWWKCDKQDDHEWDACINKRAIMNRGCPYCARKKACQSNCLEATHPELTKQWHPTKNGDLTAQHVTSGSGKAVWWQCENEPEHEWLATISNRVSKGHGCGYCNSGWSLKKIRLFVASILQHIEFFSPAELYVIFQQTGIIDSYTNRHGRTGPIVEAIRSGKFLKEELEKFSNNQPSLLDEILNEENIRDSFSEKLEIISESQAELEDEHLPIVETKDVLDSLTDKVIANCDEEAVEYLICSGAWKIWCHAFINEEEAVNQATNYHEKSYAQKEVKTRFLSHYEEAKNLTIPEGYSFSVNGRLQPPNLMQRYTAYLVKLKKRIGNWSGTGAGKTLSAVLSSRVIAARLTIICCPNNVVERWEQGIKEVYPDSIVFTKSLDTNLVENKNHYVLLNYEFFQRPNSEAELKAFLLKNKIDFIIIDEIHHSKQRAPEEISKRKAVVSAMCSEAASLNGDLHILGMSATPVINNLFEGKGLIELITGVKHDELKTTSTIGNCLALHQQLVLNGIRWVPQYIQKIRVQTVPVECSDYLYNIRALDNKNHYVKLESILVQAKIPTIVDQIKNKTIIYIHYLQDILAPLQHAIESTGKKVAIYSGEDKSGLNRFIKASVDVLIATSCITTGIDGLQHVCNRIIVAVLPWTHAEFEQLKGRIYRQGQVQDHVDIIVPLTYADINDKRWSWCDSRWKRILFKKSIADAAVDGVIPEGQIRSVAEAYKDTMNWLRRLDDEEVSELQRQKISLSLSAIEHELPLRQLSDFSKMNQWINTTSSVAMHEKLIQDPAILHQYHALYREARKNWLIIPVEEAIAWCKRRHYSAVIGDFGCGEALLAQAINNTVYSFDHIALNEHVLACDMKQVPLEDACLDAVIFSLSLMGLNFIDYIKEAHRCLKQDGHLWIAETTSRLEVLDLSKEKLASIGFHMLSREEKGSFTFIRAMKSDESFSVNDE